MKTEAMLLRAARAVRERSTHQIFRWLLLGQWALAIVLALAISPYTYSGTERSIHPHVILAVIGGGLLDTLPLLLIRFRPDAPITKYVVAIAQMLWSALLIAITGGRIETHFHVFVSLAFVAGYRDGRVLVTATLVMATDHFIRGMWWPDSVYGSENPAWWRFAEHVAWVLFEDAVLLTAVRNAVREMATAARQQAQLEASRALVETKIEERTHELRASVERYRTLVESTDAMPFECDPQTRALTYIAPQTERLLGYPAAALCGGPFLLPIVHADDRARVEAELPSGRPLDFRVLTPAGAVRHVRALFSAEAPNRGVLLDVTKQRELERDLNQAHKLESVGRLAAGVAHEINTPMQYISDSLTFVDEGVADLLGALGSEPAPDSELEYIAQELPRAVARALDGTARVSQIIRSMKTFASSEAHAVAMTDLNTAIASTVTIARSEYKRVADVVLDLAPLPPVACVPGEINQVLLGLLVNAAQAIGEELPARRGTITVRSRVDGEHVTFSVEDTGCGIPDLVRDRIFDPFFTTKPVGQGTGQGLAIARSIVERHHGTLTFESTVGRGSTFTVRLPIEQQPMHGVAA